MTPEEFDEQQNIFNAAIKPMSSTYLPLTTDCVTWFVILAHLQLALTHPDNVQGSSTIARQFAEKLDKNLSERFPQIAPLIEAGWRK